MCSLQNSVLEAGFVACQLPLDVLKPRSILATGTDSLLALERGRQSVVFFFDSDGDGIPDSKRDVASASGLNHGLEIRDGYIYASSDTTVYRWPYEDDFVVNGDVEIAIENMNADGNGGAPQGHTTRTLIFDDQGYLYISVGSNANVDPDSYRSRIRRFYLENSTMPLDFQLGEVFADGLRNEVGLAFDKHGDLWGVENGADNLFRSDLGGSITKDNPVSTLYVVACNVLSRAPNYIDLFL
jgi:glucose/arabinose dehydrogenase